MIIHLALLITPALPERENSGGGGDNLDCRAFRESKQRDRLRGGGVVCWLGPGAMVAAVLPGENFVTVSGRRRGAVSPGWRGRSWLGGEETAPGPCNRRRSSTSSGKDRTRERSARSWLWL